MVVLFMPCVGGRLGTHRQELHSRNDDFIPPQHNGRLIRLCGLWEVLNLASLLYGAALHADYTVVHILPHCMLQICGALQGVSLSVQLPGQWVVHSSSMYYSSSPQADRAVVDVLTHCMMHFRPLQNLMMSLQGHDFGQPYTGQT
jgi:hypothetical protein